MRIPRLLIFFVIFFMILAILNNLKPATRGLETQDNPRTATPDPSLIITAKTDKESYLLRQKVTIEGNITRDGAPATDLVVIIEAENPRGTPIAYRTLTIGNPTQKWPLNITNLFLMDMASNPINTAKIGTLIQAGIAVYNWQMNEIDAYATVTVFDANMVPLQVGFWSGTIDPNRAVSPRFSIYIEKWACSGKALICGNVYSKEPKTGGIALSQEKTSYFCISRIQQGLLEYPELPLPPPQTTPGVYNTHIRLPPDPLAGEYKIFIRAQASPTVLSSTNTAFSVQNSGGYPPQASFVFWPAAPYLNMTVNFDASSSTPEGFNDTITKYEWDLGDGTPKIIKTDPTITHAYQNTGTFIVTLNVTDNEGLWSTTSKPITIYPEFGPTANFTWKPEILIINETATFDASNSTVGWCAKTQRFSPIQSYKWNFGDGTGDITISTPIITHLFTQPANFTVQLTITDADGRSDYKSALIQVLNITTKAFDVNGDGKIDLKDIYRVGKAYGSYPGHPKWDPACDFNKDDKVDLKDYYAVCKHYGEDP